MIDSNNYEDLTTHVDAVMFSSAGEHSGQEMTMIRIRFSKSYINFFQILYLYHVVRYKNLYMSQSPRFITLCKAGDKIPTI